MRQDVDIAMLFQENQNMEDRDYMLVAIEEAKKAYDAGEIPVGCVIVLDDKIIAKAHNMTRENDCNICHAEILAIEDVCKRYGRWCLLDATIYVTLEPCLMCCGAIIQSRIKKLVYGVNEERFGACESIIKTFELKSNHKVEVEKGICKEEIKDLMQNFFAQLRKEKVGDKK